MAADKLLNFRCPLDLWLLIEEKAKLYNFSKTDIVISAVQTVFGRKGYMATETNTETLYRTGIGERHRILRKTYLDLNLREMAIFYGIKRVSDLEAWEQGKEELPLDYLNKLVGFFFINWKYLDGESDIVFTDFDLYSDQPTQLIKDGFRPYFLCCSERREDLLVYPVLHKVEEDYRRIVAAEGQGSFASSGGGAKNIERLILSMLKNSLRANDARFVKVEPDIWKSLEKGSFYNKNMNFGIGCWDGECADLFEEWFTVIEQKYKDQREQL